MNKKFILVLSIAMIVFFGVTKTTFATGPKPGNGSMEFVPLNPFAMEDALLVIMPLVNPFLAEETNISENGVDITVSEIPLAYCEGYLDPDTWDCDGTWVGPYILLKWSRAYEAATAPWQPYYTGEWTEQAWCIYSFWLNGDVVTIETNGESQEVTQFIFFKVQWVGNGEGNSDFDEGRNFDVTIQAYK